LESVYPALEVKNGGVKLLSIFLKALLKGQGKVSIGGYDSDSPKQDGDGGGGVKYGDPYQITISSYIENKPIEYFFRDIKYNVFGCLC